MVLGAGLLAIGLASRPRVPTYVNRHPWVDYVTAGVIAIAGCTYVSVRRVLLQRNLSPTLISLVALAVT